MKKIVKLKKDKKTGDSYLNLSDFKDLFDTKKIKSYKVEKIGKALKLTFFDKNEQVLKPRD